MEKSSKIHIFYPIWACNMANYDYFLPEKRIWIDINRFIRKNWLKKAFKVKSVRFFDFLVFKMFLYFSQFLVECQLQIISPSKRSCWESFFEYWNLYFTFLKARVMIQNIFMIFCHFFQKKTQNHVWGSGPPKKAPIWAKCVGIREFWS